MNLNTRLSPGCPETPATGMPRWRSFGFGVTVSWAKDALRVNRRRTKTRIEECGRTFHGMPLHANVNQSPAVR
jgi:hypothetical protein